VFWKSERPFGERLMVLLDDERGLLQRGVVLPHEILLEAFFDTRRIQPAPVREVMTTSPVPLPVEVSCR
jgi:hypothetical protein